MALPGKITDGGEKSANESGLRRRRKLAGSHYSHIEDQECFFFYVKNTACHLFVQFSEPLTVSVFLELTGVNEP